MPRRDATARPPLGALTPSRYRASTRENRSSSVAVTESSVARMGPRSVRPRSFDRARALVAIAAPSAPPAAASRTTLSSRDRSHAVLFATTNCPR